MCDIPVHKTEDWIIIMLKLVSFCVDSVMFCASHSTVLMSYVSSGTFFHFQVLFPRSTCYSHRLIDTETMPGLNRHKGVSASTRTHTQTHAHAHVHSDFLFFLLTPSVLFLKVAFVQWRICGCFSCANMFWSNCLLTKGKTTRKYYSLCMSMLQPLAPCNGRIGPLLRCGEALMTRRLCHF